MCVIAAKPAGVKMPTREQIQTMWYNNPDGAGIMYVLDGQVNIDKGYMRLSDFLERVQSLQRIIDMDAIPVVLHFRIASAGGVRPENCHPFPLTACEKVIRELRCTTELGMAHNGTIHGYGNSSLSDTMQFMLLQLAPMSRAVPRFWNNRYCLEMIANATRGSWIVLLGGDGALVTIGDFFLERNGIYYSNKTYQDRPCLIDVYEGSTHRTGADLPADLKELVYLRKAPLNWLLDDGNILVLDGEGRPQDMEQTRWLLDQRSGIYRWYSKLDGAVEADGYRALQNGHTLAFDVDAAVMTEIFGKLGDEPSKNFAHS